MQEMGGNGINRGSIEASGYKEGQGNVFKQTYSSAYFHFNKGS